MGLPHENHLETIAHSAYDRIGSDRHAIVPASVQVALVAGLLLDAIQGTGYHL